MSDGIISYFEKDRFAAFVGAKLVEVKPGYAKAMLEISDKHLNAADIVQGGVTFTLADFAFAAASNSHGQLSLSVNTTISYFRPPTGKILVAEAKEISITNKLASYNIDVFDENGGHIARLTGMVFRKKEMITSE
ncbi:MAG: PaaI family thioesterase [Desulfitobacteriaceae bacterium]|nr:PaaI family thioesterase [Desulfitobacteriaceae bacterium]MDD4345556.1 PaaI family thioesterase [Desulfitobacteriaceae bacterium]MDD4401220.1 PaaI family thioesterase [Desulfitobacteriaceae bacterium]